jgi:hypothetical protein
MRVTVTLKKVSVGTELSIVQEGIPDVIPPEACYLGWQESLTLLAKLVEAEIPDLNEVGPVGPFAALAMIHSSRLVVLTGVSRYPMRDLIIRTVSSA